MTVKNGGDELTLEITVLSAESLKNRSASLRPYVTLSPYTDNCTQPYRTRVADAGPGDPTWHDTFRIPVDPTLFLVRKDDAASVHVSVLSRGRGYPLLGPTELGWCLVRPCDVADVARPLGMPRRISYALRTGRHGGRGHGVLHLSVRLVGPALGRVSAQQLQLARQEWGPVAIGIPVGPVFNAAGWGSCEDGTSCRIGKAF